MSIDLDFNLLINLGQLILLYYIVKVLINIRDDNEKKINK